MLWRIVMVVCGSARAIDRYRPAIALTLCPSLLPRASEVRSRSGSCLRGKRPARVAEPAIVPLGSSFLAPSGFEPLSPAPKASMLGRYTTGLLRAKRGAAEKLHVRTLHGY